MSAPAVAVSRDGKKFASAWMDERSGKGKRRVYWSVGDSPALKGELPVGAATVVGTQDHPSLVFDESGTLWAAWEQRGEGDRRTVWVRSGAKESKPTQASDDSQGNAAYPAIASGGGVVGLVFEARGEGEPVVFKRLR